mmetsp:Transcript_19463/g.29543  ORF Transcript_19463/g.29543 Transcript_19463/m.29543 type:complete len:100 (-) Transcript_19463:110-409(-)
MLWLQLQSTVIYKSGHFAEIVERIGEKRNHREDNGALFCRTVNTFFHFSGFPSTHASDQIIIQECKKSFKPVVQFRSQWKQPGVWDGWDGQTLQTHERL